MGQCKVLKAQAEKMRATHMAKSSEQKSEERRNKRKFADSSQLDLNALIEASVKAQLSKKQKSSASSSASSSDGEELNDFE